MPNKEIILNVECRICKEVKGVKVHQDDYKRFQQNSQDYIQDIFPYLTPGQRELLITQTCESCFDNLFDEEM